MSECSGPFSSHLPTKKDKEFKPRSCGKPVTGLEVMIYNPDENGIGEVCMFGRNVFMGYYKDSKRTK